MKKITLSLLLLAAFVSCKKTTNTEVVLPTSGKLTYKLVDDAGKGITGVNVNLYDLVDGLKIEPVILDQVVTNANGVADFGELNPATYYIVADSPKVNNIYYIIKDYVQVIRGSENQKSVKVTDYSALASLKFVSDYYQTPAPNIGVLLIPFKKFTGDPVSALLKVADYKGTTNAAGEVTFRVPSLKNYTVVAYNINTGHIYDGYMNFTLITNENKKLTYGLPI
jgi:hypothetical protein